MTVPLGDAVYVGGPGDGNPVAFVHGAGLSWRMWLPQVRALGDDYRVVAPDLPGHGRRMNERFSLDAAAEALGEALADATDRPALVVGQSLGGYVAVEFADRRPDRVAGLLLSGASADYRGLLGVQSAVAGAFNRVRAAVGPLERRFRERVESKLRSTSIDEDVVEAILDGGVSLAGYGQGASALSGVDFPSKLRAYDGPVLLVNGEDDRINPDAAASLAPTLPDAETRVIDGAGHTCNLDRPDEYSNVVRAFAGRVWDRETGGDRP